MKNLSILREQTLKAIEDAADLTVLEAIRVNALGKQGEISLLMKKLGTLDPQERREQGQHLNELRILVTESLGRRKSILENQSLEERLATEKIDVTLPQCPQPLGTIHPLSQVMYEVIQIFKKLGFAVAEGPNIEDDEHNFTALNVPLDHPARLEQDTFYLPQSPNGITMLLRTQTSPVQIRTLKTNKPPIRIIVPGRVFRSDSDATHTPNFHQMEGLLIDKDIHMGHLKGCLITFCKEFFGMDDLPVRFRPAFFPFTEPSVEIDIGCKRTGQDMKIGKGTDWLEILGAGMVHPNVFRNCGLDPEEHQGFAFGMGLERLAMLKYGMPDLRAFYECDIRWLRHYGFSVFDALSEEILR
ncbi:MAG: phenylalanine--tRNA ligase subunit alpha [Alphaproteobacteria bacterium]|nr:phenylalanine--tRNA ligase subunit alpha [Alphaproteobacteria bacterium]